MYKVLQENIRLSAPDIAEIYRYAGGRGEIDSQTAALLEVCLQESESQITPHVCYCFLPAEQAIESFGKDSTLLKSRLCGADKVLLFAATLGLGIDRLIRKYTCVSPSKALYFQAIGAERIESVCNAFCQTISARLQAQGQTLGVRFSPGYGDFPLQAQTQIHALLNTYKQIGVGLNESLLMSPSKSVTALCAVGKEKRKIRDGCQACTLENCAFRTR